MLLFDEHSLKELTDGAGADVYPRKDIFALIY